MVYDASQLEPGAAFNCTNCGTLVTYGQQPRPARGRGAARAQAQAGGGAQRQQRQRQPQQQQQQQQPQQRQRQQPQQRQAAPRGPAAGAPQRRQAGVPQRGPGALTVGPMRAPGGGAGAPNAPRRPAPGQGGDPYGGGGRNFPQPKKSNTGLVIGVVIGVVALLGIILAIALSGGGSGDGSGNLNADVQQILSISATNQPVIDQAVIDKVQNALNNGEIPKEQEDEVARKLSIATRIRKNEEVKQKNAKFEQRTTEAEASAREVGNAFYKALRNGDVSEMAQYIDGDEYHRAVQGQGFREGTNEWQAFSTYNYELVMSETGYVSNVKWLKPMTASELKSKGLEYLVSMWGPGEGRSHDMTFAEDKDTESIVFGDPLASDEYQVTMNIELTEADALYKVKNPLAVVLRAKWGQTAKVVMIRDDSEEAWRKRESHENKAQHARDNPRIVREGGDVTDPETGEAKIAPPPSMSDYVKGQVQPKMVASIAGTPIEKVIDALKLGEAGTEDEDRLVRYTKQLDTLALFFDHLANAMMQIARTGQTNQRENMAPDAWRIVEAGCNSVLTDEWSEFLSYKRGVDNVEDNKEALRRCAWRYQQFAKALSDLAAAKAAQEDE